MKPCYHAAMPFENKKPFKKRSFDKPRTAAPPSPKSPYPGMRIAKLVARAGLGSRRDVEAAIEQGRVTVNGQKITSPALNVLETDKITLDGRPLPQRERTRIWLYHKPKGLVTTERDPEGRATVFDNLPRDMPRVMSVGRLDINTEGLLLLTNDGGLKRVLELPATGWLRRYRVRAFGDVTQDQLDTLKNGVTVNGVDYGPVEAALERDGGQNLWITMGIREGKNREIKNIAEHLGLVVNRLIRVSFGPFNLRELPPNEAREISLRLLADQLGPRLMREAGIDFGKAKHAHAPVPRLEKHRHAGKHEGSATAKAERYADWQTGEGRRVEPDFDTRQLRLEPKTFSDRKGRKVGVAKTMKPVYKKKFDKPRFETDARKNKRTERSDHFRKSTGEEFQKRPRFESSDERKPYSGDKPYGEKKPFKKRFERAEGAERKPYSAGKPFRKKFEGDGERKPFKKRYERAEGGERKPYSGDKPFRKKFDGGKPFKKRHDRAETTGERPRAPFGKGKPGGFKGKGAKPFGKKPYSKKPFGKKPFRRDS
jgi:23S rRNA pseudouridine2605 synthase